MVTNFMMIGSLVSGNSPLWIAVIALALILVAAVKVLEAQKKGKAGSGEYVAVDALLSEAEKLFHETLQAAMGGQYWVYPKVGLDDLVSVKNNPDHSAWQSARNRISQKHVDFVLCEPGTFRIVAVVELDDSTHQEPKGINRDKLVDAILKQAKIPILHVRASNRYDAQDIAAKIAAILPPT